MDNEKKRELDGYDIFRNKIGCVTLYTSVLAIF